MTTLTRDDTLHGVEYVTKHEAQHEIDAAHHRGMMAVVEPPSPVPDSYVPFGPEWERELMKTPKKFIVEMLRKALMANQAAKDSQEMAEAREREENLRK